MNASAARRLELAVPGSSLKRVWGCSSQVEASPLFKDHTIDQGRSAWSGSDITGWVGCLHSSYITAVFQPEWQVCMALYSSLAQGGAKVGGLACSKATTFHLAVKDRMTFIFRWTTSTCRGLNVGYFCALSKSEPQAKAFKVGVQCCIVQSLSGISAPPAIQLIQQYKIVGCCVLASRSVAGAPLTS